jgi:predicted GIY-YIG superfamily endonuclease
MWFCYILRNKDPKYKTMTYNGSTNDPNRRLRQHNEEITGGAKATHGKGQAWEIYALMTGFPDHINALSCEWRIKHPTGKPGKRLPEHCGVHGRIRGLNEVLCLDKWTSKCTVENKTGKFRLYLVDDVAHLIKRELVPENVEIVTVPKITDEHFMVILPSESSLESHSP